ncbi:MAG TPA: hypothetical protein VJN67_07260 [Stellaceae bacterium]|nr:hypothetical protein [Stellaceae bacterium]
MTLPALDMAPSSTSPLPDGAITPPSGDGTPEAAATPESPTAKSPASDASPARPPAASLISIATKGKSSGSAKTGDLTRFFELARHQPAPTATSEPPAAAPTPAPIAEVEVAPSVAVEPSFPLMLAAAPVATDADAPMLVRVEPDPAPSVESDASVVPDWVKALSTVEDTLPSEMAEPPKVSLSPMEETPLPAATLDIEGDQTETAPAAIIEPPPPPKESGSEPPIATAPVMPTAAPIPAAPRAPVFKELVDYWRSLRRGDDNPTPESIDRDLVIERWPGSLLMTYMPASQDPRGELRPTRVTRLGTACAESQSVAEVGSQSTEWMLEAARTALVNDEPVEEQQRLETLTGVAGFRIVALPLGPPNGLPNAVLCILTPSPGAPRFGKRRVWL